MLQTLSILREWSEPSLHQLVTSRDEVNIRDELCNELGALEDMKISMRNNSVNRDIAAFVSQQLRDNRKLRKMERPS